MAASYPTSVKTYTDKIDGTDYVKAADVNSLQSEVNAIESTLGTSPQTSALPSSAGTYNASGVSTSVAARLTNVEAGLTNVIATDATHVGYTQLAQQTLATTASTGTVTFSSISQAYQKLVLLLTTNSSSSAVDVTVTLNSTTTTGTYVYNAPTFASATFNTTANTSPAAITFGTTDNASVKYSGSLELPNYSNSNNYKNFFGMHWKGSVTGVFNQVSNISVITVSVPSSTLNITATLYGVK
jgi:hypothetical protein